LFVKIEIVFNPEYKKVFDLPLFWLFLILMLEVTGSNVGRVYCEVWGFSSPQPKQYLGYVWVDLQIVA
jgi:hypothetical protein